MIIIIGKDKYRIRLAKLESWVSDFERVWKGRAVPAIWEYEYINKCAKVAELREILKIVDKSNGEKK